MKKDEYIRKSVVTNVVDGDTIDAVVDLGYQIKTEQRFRLLGINTPERGEEGYNEVKKFVTEKLLDKEVYIQSSKDDSFGRYLADVYYHDGENQVHLNQQLLENKLAKPYKKG
ncbi:MAG TPA: thermonuclease family protein [Bacillus sp. (in: firmicutes)]|nr:thermonuclease family protein [Bacillus sp. (in: firmicutes)]